MRQVADTLVWLALIVVVVAVVYFTPQLASYVSSRESDAFAGREGGMAWRVSAHAVPASAEGIR
jgi:hypothetical protein